jgi:hypothetical protein
MKEANLQRPALRCARCGHGPSTQSHPGGEDSLSDLPMRDDPVEHTVASDLPPHRETAEQGKADGLNAAANAATGAGEPLISGTAFPDLGRLVRTALLEMQARAVAVEAALGMLLAAEASRNPALPEAMRAKLDDMLRAMPEPSDPGLPARTRAAFHTLLGSADAAAEEAKAAQAQRKQPSMWDSLRGRK